jgi:hypothetical protein
MAALDRHAQHVAFIKAQGYVAIEQPAPGGFTCKSVRSPADMLYSGCIGELFCTCPQCDRDVCKHLDAATDTLLLTHERRLATARALVESGKLEVVDLAEGVLVCRQVQNKNLKQLLLVLLIWQLFASALLASAR